MIQLIHGDCYQEIKKIPDKSVDLVYTDIPYLFVGGGGGGAFGSNKKSYREEIILTDNENVMKYKAESNRLRQLMREATNKTEYEKWHSQHANILKKINYEGLNKGCDLSILSEFCRVLKYIYIYIWCSKEQILPIMKFFEDKNCKVNILVWCKTNPTPSTNNNWLPDVEYCLVFKEEGAPRYNDGYELKSRWYVSPLNKSDKDIWGHPTIKPLELVERHIKHSTNPGDTVLDCFMGSGTTGVACRNLDRNFIGIEIDQKYFDIAKRRIETQVQQTQLF